MLFVTGLVLHLREWMDQRRRHVGRNSNPKAATLVHYLFHDDIRVFRVLIL